MIEHWTDDQPGVPVWIFSRWVTCSGMRRQSRSLHLLAVRYSFICGSRRSRSSMMMTAGSWFRQRVNRICAGSVIDMPSFKPLGQVEGGEYAGQTI